MPHSDLHAFTGIQPYRLGEEYGGSDFSPAFELPAAEARPGRSDLICCERIDNRFKPRIAS